MKRIVQNVFLVVMIIVISLGMLELIFRIARPTRAPLAAVTQTGDGALFVPNSVFQNTSSIKGEFDVTVHVNKFGYRGVDFDRAKSKPRIFMVGDSFTFGVGAKDDQTIPYLLEQQLQNQGYDIEVVNAGVGHTSPLTHYLNLRDLHLQFEPDLVILLLDFSDLADDWRQERNAMYDDRGQIMKIDPTYINGKRDWWRTAVLHSAFCKYLNNKLIRTFKKMEVLGFWGYIRAKLEGKRAKAVIATSGAAEEKLDPIEYDGYLFMRGEDKHELIKKHWVRTMYYLNKIDELLASRDIPWILVMYPYGIHVGTNQWSSGRTFWGFDPDTVYDGSFAFGLGENYARMKNIPFINTFEYFIPHAEEQLFFDYDGHMTPRANEVVVDKISHDTSFLKILDVITKKRVS